MLNQIKLKNFGPLSDLEWSDLGKINLVIGANGTGKTFLLKAIYSAIRTLEEYKRGDENSSDAEILARKLYWTFQAEKIGDLVSKGADAPLSCQFTFTYPTRDSVNLREFKYSFGKETKKQISILQNDDPPLAYSSILVSRSIFLPAKEVLSLFRAILKSREEDQAFGFDDTHLDLVRVMQWASVKNSNKEFSSQRKILKDIMGGVVEYDEELRRWQFIKGRHKFPMGVTAEGVKKIAMLDILLGNRYLGQHSIVLIDEPESALHPAAISQFLDVLVALAEYGLQFFLASHSYFVIEKLFLIAQQKKWSIPVILADQGVWRTDDLENGMPENPIVDESIRLYEEEVGMVLK